MQDLNPFGAWLKRRRKSLDLSREELAQQAHCSAITIRRLEEGSLRASKALAELLTAVLGISPEEREGFVRFARGEGQHYPVISGQYPVSSTPPVISTNLPTPLTSFVGRKREVTAVCELLRQPGVRLLTLTGPPGVGKTRLSIAIGNRLADTAAFPDGVFFVSLAPIREPGLVISAVAQALNVREPTQTTGEARSLHHALKTFFASKRLLLVLDNFEQVTAAAPLITEWLTTAPGLKALVTSRENLHTYGEHEFPVPPLDIPDINHLPSPQARSFYTHHTAIQLFKERAQAVQHHFRLTPDNLIDVARICAWLDGLPLAIEMAAAQVKWLPTHKLYEQLSHRLAILTGGPRDLTPRQQSLNGAIEWSYHLLDPLQQRLFNLSGIFVGGYSIEAVSEIGDWKLENRQTLTSNLQSLIEKSLLRHDILPDGEIRYWMLETLREYAQERLKASGIIEQIRQAHAGYYFQLAQTAKPHLILGGDQVVWLNQLEQEHHNLRAALTWATEGSNRARFAQEMTLALSEFWDTRGYISEGRHWIEAALKMDDTPTGLRAHLLNDVGWLARLQGDLEGARNFQQQALAIQEQLGDESGASRSLENLAILASSQGDCAQASNLLEQSLVIRRKAGDATKILSTLNNLAIVAWQLEDFGRAEQLYRECAELSQATQNKKALSRAVHGLGTIYLSIGNYPSALASFQETLHIRQELGDRPGLAVSLSGVAEVFFHLGRVAEAVQLMSSSDKLLEDLGKVAAPAAQAETEVLMTQMRSHLGEEAFTQAWVDGQAMSLEEAITFSFQSV